MGNRVYILGGAQTDFSQNWHREILGISDLLAKSVEMAVSSVDIKLENAQPESYVFPELYTTIQDALRRANIGSVHELDAIETHDCFTISEYVALEHFGLARPGEAWKVLESGNIEIGGSIPVNPSGGLIGAGHPVGVTGVRMILDAYKQVADRAGNYQVEGARDVGLLNIGGSFTTIASFVVGVD